MKVLCSVVLVFQSFFFAYGQSSENSVSYDFVMQDIRDIVYAVSIAQGISIVCDDTINGETSFRFSGSDFESAAKAFLLSNRLYAKEIDDVIVLSKIEITQSDSSDYIYDISAYDIAPSILFNKLSEESKIPITYDLLPSSPISIHLKNVNIEEAVSIVMQSFSDYSVKRNEKSISVSQNNYGSQTRLSHSSRGGIGVEIEKEDGLYSLDVQSGSFFDSIETLFSISENQFCNLLPSDRLITRLVFSSLDFDNVLTVLCSQAEARFAFNDGMYIIYGFENASSTLKNSNKNWKTISLKYISSEAFSPLFAKRFPSLDLLVLSSSDVQVEMSAIEEEDVESFVLLCDVPEKTHLVELQYITSEKLLEHLPPGISADQFYDSGNGHSLFFTGSNESYARLKKSLEVVDCPAVIIGYDLLVLQVQESESMNWKPSFSAEKVSLGDRTAITGHLGSVAALNLDVVTAFGYTFAADLQIAIGENKAQVYVDTKLQGISGSPIHFQNTNTYRYQDTAIDPDTGKPVYSGITREIIAGLVLNIEGWVSGDGMVTTKVTASLSRRGADVSENGNPPPTSEKVVTTEVRGKSGEPIVLSGLVQNDSTFVEEGVPLISKIPLLGWLFKSNQKNEEKNEMIIYLVPHVHTNTVEAESVTF